MLGKIIVMTKKFICYQYNTFLWIYLPVFFFSLFYIFQALFLTYYSSSNFKSFTDIQEVGSGMGENNSVWQEHPNFCFTIIQVSVSTLAFCIYCHWAVPSWVSEWAFAESGCIFAHWEPGLIPLNKICSKKTFLNKIKQAKKKNQVYWFISYCLKLYKAMNPAELPFILLRQCEMLKVAWVYYYLFFLHSEKQMCISVILHVCFWYATFFIVFGIIIKLHKISEWWNNI